VGEETVPRSEANFSSPNVSASADLLIQLNHSSISLVRFILADATLPLRLVTSASTSTRSEPMPSLETFSSSPFAHSLARQPSWIDGQITAPSALI